MRLDIPHLHDRQSTDRRSPSGVTPSTLEAALNSNAYMCFYVKRHLNYRPFAVPSYKVTRETEAVKEKEKKEQQEAARMKEVEDALLALS